jgi:ribosomal protein L37AE/L43A
VARYEEALASLRRDAAGPQDLEMEIGLLLELANAHDNRVGGDAGRARARLARASLREAVKALTANQREFPNTCTLCSETMDVIENEGEVDTHASTTGSGPDAAAATRPVTCLECLHGYHSACLLRWREEKLVEEMEKMEKAKGEGEDVSGREPQKPRCPDCAKIHASRAAAAEAAQRQPRSSASAPGGFL